MLTGQFSSHALQVVHAQISSDEMRSNTFDDETVISGSILTGGLTLPCGADSAMTVPIFSTISRGSRGFPVACAGQTAVQRPHIVQASVSSSCFQVKSSMVDAPNVSSDVFMRLGIGRIAPLGRGRSFRYMFMGDVNM